MMLVHYLRVCLHLLVGLATCAAVFPWIDAAGRERRIQRWSQQLLGICGVRVALTHAPSARPAARALIVANHISWLDIFVINSIDPCRFVAETDIRGSPLLGWLCGKTVTIFLALRTR